MLFEPELVPVSMAADLSALSRLMVYSYVFLQPDQQLVWLLQLLHIELSS